MPSYRFSPVSYLRPFSSFWNCPRPKKGGSEEGVRAIVWEPSEPPMGRVGGWNTTHGNHQDVHKPSETPMERVGGWNTPCNYQDVHKQYSRVDVRYSMSFLWSWNTLAVGGWVKYHLVNHQDVHKHRVWIVGYKSAPYRKGSSFFFRYERTISSLLLLQRYDLLGCQIVC